MVPALMRVRCTILLNSPPLASPLLQSPLTSGGAPEADGPLEEGIHLLSPAPPPSSSVLLFQSLSPHLWLSLSALLSVSQAEWRGQFKRLQGRAGRAARHVPEALKERSGSKRCAACFLCCSTLLLRHTNRCCSSLLLLKMHG